MTGQGHFNQGGAVEAVFQGKGTPMKQQNLNQSQQFY
jgi:hypothetical protein